MSRGIELHLFCNHLAICTKKMLLYCLPLQLTVVPLKEMIPLFDKDLGTWEYYRTNSLHVHHHGSSSKGSGVASTQYPC